MEINKKYFTETAKEFNCTYISHGATGKGNDQIRFELSSYALNPSIKVIAPWREKDFCERFQGRNELLEYAKTNNIPVSATTKSPWSMDANIMHISYESGILEDPSVSAPDDLYQMTKNPQNGPENPTRLEIVFSAGIPVRCAGMFKTSWASQHVRLTRKISWGGNRNSYNMTKF
jgi:argininosuccinate synthase